MRIKKWVKRTIAAAALYFVAGGALLVCERILGEECLPHHLQNRLHDDYPRYLQWVPRRATSWNMVQPPTMVMGTQKNYHATRAGGVGPKAIPARGEWQLSFVQVRKRWPFFLPYFAVTLNNDWHARVGCRWDENDSYYSFPSVTVKKLKQGT